MLNHGVSTGALFLMVGILYERTHTRLIADYGGIAKVVPGFAAMFLVVTLASIGLPGLNGFVSEFLVLSGTFLAPHAIAGPNGVGVGAISAPVIAGVAGVAVVLGAVYMLTLYQKVMLGPIRRPERQRLADLTVREWVTVVPLVAMVVVMGVVPQPFLERFQPAVEMYVKRATSPTPPPMVALGKKPPEKAAVQPAEPPAAKGTPTVAGPFMPQKFPKEPQKQPPPVKTVPVRPPTPPHTKP